MAEPDTTQGQGAEGSLNGTTQAPPEGNAGQSAATAQTTHSGPDAEGSFFDPESIKGKPELESLAKQLQASYTKKTQAIAKDRTKVEQYDKFMANPIDTMREIAQQMGWQLVQGQAPSSDGKPKTYDNWDQVMEDAEARVMDKLKPAFGELQNLKKQNIEMYLDNNFSDWRTYEDDMMDNLRKHPSLVEDPATLYRLSVPNEVLEAKAMKKAMAKLNGDTQQVSGQSTTTKQTGEKPSGPLSFEQSVEVARQTLAKRGMTAPRE